MSPQTARSLYWLPGPLIAVSLVVFAVTAAIEPGSYLFAIVAGGIFMTAMPLFQMILIGTHRLNGRYGAACLIAFAISIAFLTALGNADLF